MAHGNLFKIKIEYRKVTDFAQIPKFCQNAQWTILVGDDAEMKIFSTHYSEQK